MPRFTQAEWAVIDSMHEPYHIPDRIYDIVETLNNQEFWLYCEWTSRHSKAEVATNAVTVYRLYSEADVIDAYSNRIAEIRKEYQRQGRLNTYEWGFETPGVRYV